MRPFILEDPHAFIDALQADIPGFERLAKRLKEAVGINLSSNAKNYCLMASRLNALMREQGFKGYREYDDFLTSNPRSMSEFISALTTNTTEFFRENKHFEILRNSLPEIIDRKSK